MTREKNGFKPKPKAVYPYNNGKSQSPRGRNNGPGCRLLLEKKPPHYDKIETRKSSADPLKLLDSDGA